MKLTIKGNPVSKKNHGQIITVNGRPRIIPSKPYRDYEKLFLPQIPDRCKRNIELPHTLKCEYYMETRRKVDLGNLLNATCDLLVKAGVLRDDNSSIIFSHDGSRVYYDKDNPREEIELIPAAVNTQEAQDAAME
jgi:Holliday junction resolvase RusA-like endonuclease